MTAGAGGQQKGVSMALGVSPGRGSAADSRKS